MKQLEKIIVTLCRIGICLAFAVLIAAVLTQVLGRLIGSSPVWTEELTRYALLYTAAFGVGLALRSGDLVSVDVLPEALGQRGSWWLRLLTALITTVMCLMLLKPAWQFVSIGRLQTSPALGISMLYVHLSVFVLLLCLCLFSLLRAATMCFNGDSGLPARDTIQHNQTS